MKYHCHQLPWNVILLHCWYLISYLLISYIANKWGNCKYMGIQNWQLCQYCQFCTCNFVKNPKAEIEMHEYLAKNRNLKTLPCFDCIVVILCVLIIRWSHSSFSQRHKIDNIGIILHSPFSNFLLYINPMMLVNVKSNVSGYKRITFQSIKLHGASPFLMAQL